ncbi:MAG: PKD domain-containing protein, partial [Bacteroidales bacterium]|nr:PKD domain-containing protein [Bacteroidales bacterium]
ELRIFNGVLSEAEIAEIYNLIFNADFVSNVTEGNVPLTTHFTDISASNPITWKWDFENNGTIDSYEQNPEWTYTEPGIYSVSLTISYGENEYTEMKEDYITVFPVETQEYSLSIGYQLISSRILPLNSDMLDVLENNLNDNLDFVRNTGGFMVRKIGPIWINSIGDWITTEAYLFKMNNEDQLTITGPPIDPQTPINLTTGYQMISYLPWQAINALDICENILDNLDFVRNTGGFMLRKIGPVWVNSIGDMKPDEGYLVKMNAPDVLIYPGSTSFTCGDPFTDTRDGQIYNTVQIGDQCWMAENMNIGTMINGNNNQTNNDVIEKYCYDNNLVNCETYGGLYQWDEMMEYTTQQGIQGICPEGWHIPTDDEWKVLEGTVDSQYPVGDPIWNNTSWRGYDAGFNIKSNYGWSYGGNGIDLYEFTAIPAGIRDLSGNFIKFGESATFWSSNNSGSNKAWDRGLAPDRTTIDRHNYEKGYGWSVRCLKDDCGDPFTDSRDGQVYNTVLIGDQCWMAENMNIGTMINGNNNQTNNGEIEKYCYDNDAANCDEYGGLYQWDEMMEYTTQQGTQGICPEGWHIPTDDEWKVLEGTVDSQYPVGDPIWNNTGWRGYDAGNNLKSTSGWNNNGNGTNIYGFTLLPSGFYSCYSNNFEGIGDYKGFWTSSEISNNFSFSRFFAYNNDKISRNNYNNAKKWDAYSSRCLKDETISKQKERSSNPSDKNSNQNQDVKVNGDSSTVHYIFKGGNPAEAVYTIYIAGLEAGDEIAAYDGTVMVGAKKTTSQNALQNELPVFRSHSKIISHSKKDK